MSTGHRHAPTDEHYEQYYELQRKPWFRLALTQRTRIVHRYDLPYVAGASTTLRKLLAPEGEPGPLSYRNIFVDRHAYAKVV
jgi:hypothetical protein